MAEPKVYDLDEVTADDFVSVACIRQNYSKFRRYLELRAHCNSPRTAFSMAFRGLNELAAREAAKGKPHAPDTIKARAIENCEGFSEALKKRIEEVPLSELWNEEIAVNSLVQVLFSSDATQADRAGCIAELDAINREWRDILPAGLVSGGVSALSH